MINDIFLESINRRESGIFGRKMAKNLKINETLPKLDFIKDEEKQRVQQNKTLK